MPTIPDQAPKMKYRVPMSLWFVEKNQRLMNIGKVAECYEAVGCKSTYDGLIPSFIRLCSEIHDGLQVCRCALNSAGAWGKQKLVGLSA